MFEVISFSNNSLRFSTSLSKMFTRLSHDFFSKPAKLHTGAEPAILITQDNVKVSKGSKVRCELLYHHSPDVIKFTNTIGIRETL